MTPTENIPQSELLGEIVTWDMGAMEVPLSQVQSALGAAGIPDDEIRELRNTTAFSRAIKEFRKDRTIDKVEKQGDAVTFQFTQKYLKDARLNFSYEAKVTLDTATGDISCPESWEIEGHAQARFAHCKQHRVTSDVTRLVQKLFERHADLYPINPRKGVAYFVPEAHREFSGKVETFLRSLGGVLLRFPVPKGTPEGNRSVQAAVETGLETLTEELDEAVDEWSSSTRDDTMMRAAEKIRLIRYKIQAYAEYLGDGQSRLMKRLEDSQKRLLERVEAIQAEKANEKAVAV